jgi:hypothetical protein
MTSEKRTGPLRSVPGLICTAWLGLTALTVIVFGAGGWESWPH